MWDINRGFVLIQDGSDRSRKDFWVQKVMTGHLSPLRFSSEWTLCLFATYLADSLRHSSIKVDLSAVRSLHVDQGFPDPPENCLRLQRVVRGIKRSQGALPSRPRLPVSSNILRIIYSALDLNPLTISCFGPPVFWLILVFCGLLSSLSPAHQPSEVNSKTLRFLWPLGSN